MSTNEVCGCSEALALRNRVAELENEAGEAHEALSEARACRACGSQERGQGGYLLCECTDPLAVARSSAEALRRRVAELEADASAGSLLLAALQSHHDQPPTQFEQDLGTKRVPLAVDQVTSCELVDRITGVRVQGVEGPGSVLVRVRYSVRAGT